MFIVKITIVKPMNPTKKEASAKKPKEPKIKEIEKKETPIDDLTIEIEGVKSPLLKKLIKDIREE